MDAVTEVLVDRSRYAQNLSRMVVVSLLLHGALITAITVLPRFMPATPRVDRPVMTITLGGAPGPQQGHNMISAKAVQEAVPEAVKPKNDAPPALPKPQMVEAVKSVKPEPKAVAKPDLKNDVQPLRGRTPTQGAEVKPGIARVDTHGAAAQFGGLSTSGGGGGGAITDVKDFCCPEYLTAITELIRRNWQQNQQQDGSSVIAFTIHRDGSITNVVAEQGPNAMLNLVSQRAIVATERVTPLPEKKKIKRKNRKIDKKK